jgi:hypothetical protein
MLFTQLYVKVGNLLICGEIWAHKTSLTPPLLIEVPVPS